MVSENTAAVGGPLQTAIRSVEGALDAARSMPVLFASTLLASLLLHFTEVALPAALPQNFQYLSETRDEIVRTFSVSRYLFWILSQVPAICATAVVFAPLAVAVHRFILLGQVTPGAMSIGPPYTKRFIGWAILLQLILVCVGWLVGPFSRTLVALILAPLALVTVVVITVRTLLIFPAIAIESADASWKRIWNGTRYRFWRIAIAMLFLFAPILAALLLIEIAWHGTAILQQVQRQTPPGQFQWLDILVTAASRVVVIALGAALASRLYWSFSRPATAESES